MAKVSTLASSKPQNSPSSPTTSSPKKNASSSIPSSMFKHTKSSWTHEVPNSNTSSSPTIMPTSSQGIPSLMLPSLWDHPPPEPSTPLKFTSAPMGRSLASEISKSKLSTPQDTPSRVPASNWWIQPEKMCASSRETQFSWEKLEGLTSQ